MHTHTVPLQKRKKKKKLPYFEDSFHTITLRSNLTQPQQSPNLKFIKIFFFLSNSS